MRELDFPLLRTLFQISFGEEFFFIKKALYTQEHS